MKNIVVLEVLNGVKESTAVVTIPVSAVQALQSDQVLAVRSRFGY
ncbi:MAG: hypothetical protein NW224_10605 [Leptolyngbyaceae cyanobacterium bins.302]|nr:hypothetical protein [Leptolyngbyaceae cyanobacterium bins.302]